MSEKNEQVGKYVTKPQLAVILGGPEQEGVPEMTDSYWGHCKNYGCPMVSYNSWLQAEMCLYVEALLTSTVEKTWQEIASSHNSVNIWEERRRECVARRNYALACGLNMNRVAVEDVANSAEGMDYWVEAKVVLTAGSVSCNREAAKAKPKPKPKAKEANSQKKPINPETVLKGVLAEKASEMVEVRRIKKAVGEAPQTWRWAEGFLEEVDDAIKQIEKAEEGVDDTFSQKFVASSISPAAMKKLKKEYKDYNDLVQQLLEAVEPGMRKLSESLQRVKSGEQAFNGVGDGSSATPTKGKKRGPATPASAGAGKVQKR